MSRKTNIITLAIFVLLLGINAFGQETTGSIDITVKDPNGAVLPNVAVTIESAGTSAGFRRTVNTDDQGFVRIIQVPPGVYKVTAAETAGFKTRTVPEVGVSLGRTTQ